MKTSFPKPYSTPKQIVQILKKHGMCFNDEDKTKSYPMNIGYHRMFAYIFLFYKIPKNDLILKNSTTFEQVMLPHYRFDKKLRIVLFNEIEKIEVAIPNVLANVDCQELGFKQMLVVIEKELALSKEE